LPQGLTLRVTVDLIFKIGLRVAAIGVIRISMNPKPPLSHASLVTAVERGDLVSSTGKTARRRRLLETTSEALDVEANGTPRMQTAQAPLLSARTPQARADRCWRRRDVITGTNVARKCQLRKVEATRGGDCVGSSLLTARRPTEAAEMPSRRTLLEDREAVLGTARVIQCMRELARAHHDPLLRTWTVVPPPIVMGTCWRIDLLLLGRLVLAAWPSVEQAWSRERVGEDVRLTPKGDAELAAGARR
jgi:hypothetical protein